MTNALLSAEPGPGGTCRVCGAALPAGSKVCATCGAAYGEGNRCPHCRAVADVEPSDRFRFRCRVCGGPRIPLDDPDTVRSGREIRLLEKARRADVRASLLRAGGAALFGSFAISLLVALFVLAVATPGVIGSAGALLASLVPLLLGAHVFKKGGAVRAEARDALDKAWLLVASDVVRDKGRELKAEELGRILRVDEARAELLLAELSVNDYVHARIDGAGGVDAAALERVRVALGEDVEVEPAEAPPAAEKSSRSEP